jgi:anaerobic selenocysteine-containing dehydrogenase
LFTADKRIKLVHDLYVADLERLRARRNGRPESRNGLVLIGRRHLRSNNSWMHNSRRLVKGKSRCTLMIHPADAADRGLEEGATAAVSSRAGEVQLPVAITETSVARSPPAARRSDAGTGSNTQTWESGISGRPADTLGRDVAR